MTTIALEAARVRMQIPKAGQNLKVLLVISVSLFFVWYAVVENSLAQLEN